MIILTDFRREIVLPDKSQGSLQMLGFFKRLPGYMTANVQCGETYEICGTNLVVRGQSTWRENCAVIAPKVGENSKNRYLVDEIFPFHVVMREEDGKVFVRAMVIRL